MGTIVWIIIRDKKMHLNDEKQQNNNLSGKISTKEKRKNANMARMVNDGEN